MLLGIGIAVDARAGILDAPGEDLEVSLMTYGPGDIYWERFGHNAIRIRDRVSGQSGDFNYGVFDFGDSGFFWKFARGRMRYMIDVDSSDIDQQTYIDAGRSVLEQRLALSSAQAAELRARLLWNLRPENRSYDYDYFTSNCSTRIRDALNLVVHGALRAALVARPAPMTYRQQVRRLMSPQPMLMLAMDFGLGPEADQPLDEWQESFLPMILAREVRSVRIPDDHGGVHPLVASEREISPTRHRPSQMSATDLAARCAIAGLALAVLMLVSRSALPVLRASLAIGFFVVSGIAGTVLIALWALTVHHAAWRNENLLLYNPLAFAILVAAWQARQRPAWERLAAALVAIQLGAAFFAVLQYSLAGMAQRNLPWIMFALPVWLVIGFGLRDGMSLAVFPGRKRPVAAG